MAQADSIPPAALVIEERDFELLAAQRARCEDWNPQRLELRRKLGELGKSMAARLRGEADIALDAHTSLHHPASFNAYAVDSLRAYLSRGKQARAALAKLLGSSFRKDIDSAYRHICMTLTMRADGLETGLSIHPDAWWDSQNAVGKSTRSAAEFAAVLNAARGFSLRIHEHREHPAGRIFRDELERAFKHFKIGEHYLRFTRAYPRTTVLSEPAEGLAERLATDFLALAPAYRWIAWTPDNDHLFAAGGGQGQR